MVDQAEIATDVMFKSRPDLMEIWPDVVHHAALNMSSEDVLGFMGRKLHPSLAAEVMTDARRRPDGWRVKHRMARNWVKAYTKVSVLRVETTINNPREFRVLRVINDEQGRRERRWCEMRKGVADMWRQFQVGAMANHRYLNALAAAPLKGKGSKLSMPCAGQGPSTGDATPASTHSTTATWPCFEPPSTGTSRFEASATKTSPASSTAAHPLIETKLTDDANVSPD